MRTFVTQADEDMLVQLRINGNSVKSIAKKTDYDPGTINRILGYHKDEIEGGHQTKRPRGERLKMIVELHNRGYSAKNIRAILDLNYATIWSVLEENGIYDAGTGFRGATIERVAAFADTISVGDKFRIVESVDKVFDNVPGSYVRRITVTVIAKYPHFATTDKGDFQYLDFFHGTRL